MTTRKQKLKNPRPYRSWLLHLFLFATILAFGALGAQAVGKGSDRKFAADLANFPVNPDGTISVIIQYNNAPKAKHLQELSAQGGHVTFTLDQINAVAV